MSVYPIWSATRGILLYFTKTWVTDSEKKYTRELYLGKTMVTDSEFGGKMFRIEGEDWRTSYFRLLKRYERLRMENKRLKKELEDANLEFAEASEMKD